MNEEVQMLARIYLTVGIAQVCVYVGALVFVMTATLYVLPYGKGVKYAQSGIHTARSHGHR